MPRQYTKDKTARLSFRVNDALSAWVNKRAQALGVSPCDFARSLLFQQMAVEESLKSIEAVSRPLEPVAEIARAEDEKHKKRK